MAGAKEGCQPAAAQACLEPPASVLSTPADGGAILFPMSNTAPHLPDIEDDEAAELAALAKAVEEARADPRGIPHAEMRAWLLEIAAGNFDAPPPEPRLL
jgi:hypothetical protein